MVPITFAHRGGRAGAPENTVSAFRRALDLGATGLESDCRLSGDGEVVLEWLGLPARNVGTRSKEPLVLDQPDGPSWPGIGRLDGPGTIWDGMGRIGDIRIKIAAIAAGRRLKRQPAI